MGPFYVTPKPVLFSYTSERFPQHKKARLYFYLKTSLPRVTTLIQNRLPAVSSAAAFSLVSGII